MVVAWHGHGMAIVNQTRPHCVNQMGKTHSKSLAARYGRGTAWARHAISESAFRRLYKIAESDYWLYHVFPSVRLPAWSNTAAAGRTLMKFDDLMIFRKPAQKIQVLLKSDKNIGYVK